MLLFAAAEGYINADYAVLVAHRVNRDIAGDVVLGLNDLLRSLRNIGAVTQSNIARDLLLNRYRRATGQTGFCA